MLEKFITKIKESLPEALQKKLGIQNNFEGEEDEDEDEKDASTEYRYEGFEEDEIAELESEDDEDEEREVSKKLLKKPNKNSETDAAEKKKKQFAMLVRVLIILGGTYFVVDEFLLKDMNKTVEGQPTQSQELTIEEQTQQSIAKNEDSNAPEEISVENQMNEEASEGNEVGNEVGSSDESTSTGMTENTNTQVPADDINIMQPPTDDSSITDSTSSPTLDEEVSNDISNSVDNSMESTTENNQVNLESTESASDFSPDEQSTGYTDLNSNIGSSDYTRDLIDSKETETIDKKIIDTPVKTDPPNYEKFGRGLVYNCTDKHWACIDKPAYIQCNKNFEWNKSVGEKPNCFVKAIYTEEEDCVKVQGFYVSNSEPVSECN